VQEKTISARLFVVLRTGEGDQEAFYVAARVVGPVWEQFRIPKEEFEPRSAVGRQRPPLDMTKVRSIAFAQPTVGGTFFLADLRFEFRKK
jgi:hypothetical protein